MYSADWSRATTESCSLLRKHSAIIAKPCRRQVNTNMFFGLRQQAMKQMFLWLPVFSIQHATCAERMSGIGVVTPVDADRPQIHNHAPFIWRSLGRVLESWFLRVQAPYAIPRSARCRACRNLARTPGWIGPGLPRTSRASTVPYPSAKPGQGSQGRILLVQPSCSR